MPWRSSWARKSKWPRDARPRWPPCAAAAAIEAELKSTVAGLLLNSQLALNGSEMPPSVAEKLRMVADLAGSLRQQLSAPLVARAETAA
jgi:hypothetical protein